LKILLHVRNWIYKPPMNKYRLATIILIIVSAVIIIGWDIFVYIKAGSIATESNVLKDWNNAFCFIAYAYGVIGGHWFINQKTGAKRWKIYTMIGISVSVLTFSIVAYFTNMVIPTDMYLLLGYLVGKYLWYQAK